jgi:hypothetical protein
MKATMTAKRCGLDAGGVCWSEIMNWKNLIEKTRKPIFYEGTCAKERDQQASFLNLI